MWCRRDPNSPWTSQTACRSFVTNSASPRCAWQNSWVSSLDLTKRLVYLENWAIDCDRAGSNTHVGIPRAPRLLTSPNPIKLPPRTIAPGEFGPRSDRVAVMFIVAFSGSRDAQRQDGGAPEPQYCVNDRDNSRITVCQ